MSVKTGPVPKYLGMGLAIILPILVLALVVIRASACHLRRRCRRLAGELAAAKEQANELAALLALEHDTNYRMACKMYGRAAVDRAIRKAHDKGVS